MRALRATLPIAILCAFLVPSSPLSIFGGVPLHGWADLAGLVLLAPLAFSSALRQAANRAPNPARIAALTIALLVIALKVLLVDAGNQGGFVACYRSLVPPGDTQGCQRSFDDPLGPASETKLDHAISFANQTWDLEFFNTEDYNIQPVTGGWDRTDLPFHVTWQGWIDHPSAVSIPITYTGQLTVNAGGEFYALPAQYGAPASVPIQLAAGKQHITVDYRFDDGHRVGGSPVTSPQLNVPLTPIEPTPWSQLSVLTDIGLLILLAGLAWTYIRLAGRAERLVLAGAAILALLAHAFAGLELRGSRLVFAIPSVPLVVPLIVLVWLRVQPLFMWLVSAFSGTWFAFLAFGSTAGYQLRSWGNDPLRYESFAHSILVTGSLQGGESVFYYQPFFRYVLFAEHILSGDGNALILAVAIALLWFGGLWLASSLRDRVPPVPFLGLSGLLMVILIAEAVPYNVDQGLSEYPAWIALLVAAALMLPTGRPSRVVPGAALVATAVIIRPEMLPGALALLSLGIWRTGARGRVLATSLVAFAAVSALPLAHNLYYGHSFTLFTSTANLQANFENTPASVVASPRATVGRHLIALLDLNTTGTRALDAAIHIGQLLWLCAVVIALYRLRVDRRRNWGPLAALSLPLAFALPFLVVQVEVYYPRHIIATYLMIWPALILATGMLFGPEHSPGVCVGRVRARVREERPLPAPSESSC